MRVLWFVEKQLPAVTEREGRSAIHHGSWLDQLEVCLRDTPGLTLGVAALTPRAERPYEPFESAGTMYFGIGPDEDSNAIRRVAQRWQHLLCPRVDLAACRRIMEGFRPDLVHVHGTENQFGLLAGQGSAPVVVSIQGILSVYELMEARGRDTSLLLSLSPSLFLRGTGRVLQGVAMRARAERERSIFRLCRHFIGRTRFDADVVRVLNPDAQYYHCDELLRPEFRTAVWDRGHSHPHTVYCTGGDYAPKGIGTLLRALAILGEGRAPQIRLRLAGTSPADSEDARAMAREIRRLRVCGRVTILGRLGAKELAHELLGAGAFVLPTHTDNSSNALAEAMMVGTPCVASAAGGIPTLARDGVEALLVQDGDPYSLAGAIARVLEDEGLARRLSTAARATALARHDPQRIRAELLGIYRTILDDERRPAPEEAA